MNTGKLQSLVNEDNCFCWVYKDFFSDFLLYDVIGFVRMQKSVVESWVDKTFTDKLSSFERCWSSLLRLLMALRRSFVWIDKLKLDIDFLSNCKQLGVYPKFLIFKLPNVSNKDALSIRKRLLRSTINKRNKELQHLSKELSLSVNFLSTPLSTIDFYIRSKSITSYNRKSLKKSLYTQQKKLSSLTRDCNLPIFTANETITNLTQYIQYYSKFCKVFRWIY